jgi:hypothetical protein
VERIRDTHPNYFGHIHVIEDLQRTNGTNLNDENDTHSNNEPLHKMWGNRPYIAAGGFNWWPPPTTQRRSTAVLSPLAVISLPM